MAGLDPATHGVLPPQCRELGETARQQAVATVVAGASPAP